VADNTTIDAGSGGDVIATDDIGGVKYQRVKISQGADGSATDVGIGGGTEATALRVTIASDSTGVLSIDDNGAAITVDGTVTANLGATDTAALAAIETAVEILDNAISGNEMQVDIVSAPTVTVDNAGTFAVQADTELTTGDLDTGAGTDTRAVVGLAGTASGGAQLIPGSSTDGLLVNLGTNNDVTVSGVATAANQTTVIGHLDGVEGLLTTIDGDTGTLAVTGGGTEAGALRVTVASDSTGVVSVDDNGNSLTVDNAGLTELAAAINASSQIDVNIAADGVGIGGGTQYAGDSAGAATDTGTMALALRDDAGGTLVTTDGDRTPLSVDGNGALRVTGGGGGTEYTVDAAAPAAPTGSAGLMERDDALSALTEVEGDWTNMRANANGALWIKHDGEITAALSSTDNTVLDNIDADTSAIQTATEACQTALETAGGLVVNLGANNDVTVTSGNITADTELTTADLDTGAGTDTRAVVGLAGTASGGAQLIPGSSTDGLLVNLGTNNDVTVSGVSTAANQTTIIGHVDGIEGLLTTIDADTSNLSVVGGGTEAAAIRVTIANNSTGVLSVDDNGSTISVDDGGGVLTVDGTVTANLAAGTNNIGDVDVLTIAAGTNTIGDVGIKPRTSGGYTIFRSIDLDETEEEVKATAGQVFGWYIFNAAATTHYVKFYNATTANVTVGTTTPVLTIPVPAGSAANVFTDTGIAFGTAITAAATTGVADNDTGAPAANAVVVNVFYS
jgi:hypothetical protein